MTGAVVAGNGKDRPATCEQLVSSRKTVKTIHKIILAGFLFLPVFSFRRSLPVDAAQFA
jgi:hypothetical protein